MAPSAVKWPFLMWYFSAKSVRPDMISSPLIMWTRYVLPLLPRSVTFMPGARPFPGRVPLGTYPSGVGGWGVACPADCGAAAIVPGIGNVTFPVAAHSAPRANVVTNRSEEHTSEL